MLKIIRGDILFAPDKNRYELWEDSYVLVKKGIVLSVVKELPLSCWNQPVEDFRNCLIIPGFVDLHLHASQWPNMGIGYDFQLLEWLKKYTFPLESTFSDMETARKHYESFIHELSASMTTRACILATRHLPATRLLVSMLRESGLGAFVGKVNMDRNADPPLLENTEDSIEETRLLAQEMQEFEQFHPDTLVHPILSPRFVPSTTPELMTALGKMAQEYDLPIQSHLDENLDEIAWVRQLHPGDLDFAHVYERFHLLKPDKTIMAHCIHMTEDEIRLIKDRRIFIAHCPSSNCNLASGIMPLRKYLDNDMLIGIGSDIGGGNTLDMRAHVQLAMQMSRLYYSANRSFKPVSVREAFYLATKGGGRFFGKVGSFEKGYEFDALVIDDGYKKGLPDKPSLETRLEKLINTDNPVLIIKKYVRGKEIQRSSLK
ncbi:amidohydrolase family protein [Parasporobacterium paucivorans]|uniref:Guanine deaminase n=1 Tax=Parasporobacterium paucivorans DSM 15970 TaxID=1122934 RepID=A0A1M6C746_9FIRM|nr:amidohydrolase family protein [Parasporobacterium paucivorans]SHI56877.1 guanine deaminase [Parasporobacterium paucivorans DSM 15970]